MKPLKDTLPLIAPTLILCLLAGLLIGCSAPRKLKAGKEEKIRADRTVRETHTGASSAWIDTTKTDQVEITYTKIEYYPPGANREQTPEPDKQVPPDGTNRFQGTGRKDPAPSETRLSDKGEIKSIEQLTLKRNSAQQGVSQSQDANASAREEITATDTDKKETNTEQPAPDPYRWRYILAILIVVIMAGAGICFWLRKTKTGMIVLSFIKKIFCF